MIRYKRIILIVLIALLFGLWGYLVYDMNVRYPNPEEKILRNGEQTLYKGLTLTAGDISVYSRKELEERYDYAGVESTDGTYILAEVTLENNTEDKIFLSGDQPLYWVAEIGYLCCNGINMGLSQFFKTDYNIMLNPGESTELILPYYIFNINGTYDQIKKEEIRIVYSYYPTKNYIVLEPQEE